MAAFTAPRASPSAHSNASAVVQTTQQRQEDGVKEEMCEQEDMRQNTIQEKTHEFFQMCDIEDKGYITRQDMQRLDGELPLSPEELERVFDTLDSDANGYLTLEEFSLGFSSFVSGQMFPTVYAMEDSTTVKNPPEVLYQTHWQESLDREDADEEQKHFCMLMERLGAISVFEDPAEVHSLWAQLRRDEPHLLSNFEDFLARVTFQIKAVNQEKWEMETVLQRKALTHDSEIQRLYEEMEQQIKNEKDKIALQDYERFLSQSQDLELQLCSKEKELEQLFQKQRMLERQCHDLRSEQHVTKVENVKLKQTNDELTQELEQTSKDLILAQEQLSLLEEQSTTLHEEKEREMYRLTEGLQRERASLLKQLDLLREMNKHLRDERDMCLQNPTEKQKPLINLVKQMNSSVFRSSEDKEDGQTTNSCMHNGSCQLSCHREGKAHLQRIISIEEDHLPHLLYNQVQAQTPLQECSEGEENSRCEDSVDLMMSDICSTVQGSMEEGESPTSPVQAVGKINEEIGVYPPDRFFKIVLVGNSSVGKTSLLRRFCDDCFHSGTSATVGIDYSVKTIPVDNSKVALQMWDTAGQERYRSITKQFFRKADGVVVMYDITCEHSFSAVRQWLTSVKESAGEDIPIMLIGNKTDKESERQVQKSVGEQLAKNWQLAFFECSARSGHNVMNSMVHLARILKEQEDQEKEKTVDLLSNPSEKKKSCC